MLRHVRPMFHSIRYAYKWLSVQILAAATALAFLQESLPELKEALPPDWYKWALILAIVGRFYKQPPAPEVPK